MQSKWEQPVEWKPQSLKNGDNIGFLVSSEGEPILFVNSRKTASGDTNLPTSGKLYAMIDLLGKATQMSLNVDAPLPVFFDDLYHSELVKISEDGLTATSADETGQDLKAVVYGVCPLSPLPAGFYYEVRISKTRTGHDDGLVIGVTRGRPRADVEPPTVADEVLDSWSAGFNGQACRVMADPSKPPVMVEMEWSPADLAVGDRVGFLVRRSGEAILFHNGVRVAQLPGKVPVDRALYPFVDLLGNTAGVTLVPGAAPPDAWRQAEEAAGIPPPLRRSPANFDVARVSTLVQLSGDPPTTARMPDLDDLNGVVFGDGPIARRTEGECYGLAYYEVSVDELRKGADDEGIVVGVTTKLPGTLAEGGQPQVADEVSNSWSFGYDGMFVTVGDDDTEGPEKPNIRFRSREQSLYRVSRYNRSCYGTLHPKGPDEAEEEGDADDAED